MKWICLWNCSETAPKLLWNSFDSKIALKLLRICSETTLKVLWNSFDSKIALKLLRNCSEIALKILWLEIAFLTLYVSNINRILLIETIRCFLVQYWTRVDSKWMGQMNFLLIRISCIQYFIHFMQISMKYSRSKLSSLIPFNIQWISVYLFMFNFSKLWSRPRGLSESNGNELTGQSERCTLVCTAVPHGSRYFTTTSERVMGISYPCSSTLPVARECSAA